MSPVVAVGISLLKAPGILRLTGDKRHISAPVGAQIVIVAPPASWLHVYADVVPSIRSETASIAWRSAQSG